MIRAVQGVFMKLALLALSLCVSGYISADPETGPSLKELHRKSIAQLDSIIISNMHFHTNDSELFLINHELITIRNKLKELYERKDQ